MRQINRREMLAQSAVLAAGVHLGVRGTVRAASPNSQLNIACVGVGGKGWSDMQETSVGHNIVAICDIDEGRLAKAGEAFPKAKKYLDWRKLLAQDNIDAVTVSTPDHMHAPVAISAIQANKHVYCQKPLCHSVYEARKLTEAAAAHGVVTQMGIQHHSSPRFKTTVHAIRHGAIGRVHEAHVWTDRPGQYWKQAFGRPSGNDPVPGSVAWDLWLGVAPERPYLADTYHPFKWRAFWDFGTGALGDMGCHGMDPVISAVELGAPTKVSAETSELFDDTAPAWSIVTYEFPGTSHTTDSFKMVWYDGGKRPSAEICGSDKVASWENGVVFLGEKGILAVDYEKLPILLPEDKFADYQMEVQPEDNHYQQWTAACVGQGKTSTPFSYSGPLTETVLLGNVAARLQKEILWDTKTLTAKGLPEAEALIRREYRSGWDIAGLA